ncbi:MAG: acyl-ACP--UDP-N-acetylglucosamine O-acyltransferase [bacterium]
MLIQAKKRESIKKINFEEQFFNSDKIFIHQSSIIGKNVLLEENVKIGPFCTITGNVLIKKNTVIYPNVSIGFPAQNLSTTKSLGTIEIGQNCQIREFVTISASKYETGKTVIGNNCYIMSYSHIAHDVILEDNVTLINNVNLAGHVHVEKNAFLMANAAAHQFCKIGQYTALAPYSAIRKDLPPFCMFSGLPATFYGLNINLLRQKFDSQTINSLKTVTKLFYQDKILLSEIKKIIEQNEELKNNEQVKKFINFIENSSRGVSKKSAIK